MHLRSVLILQISVQINRVLKDLLCANEQFGKLGMPEYEAKR